MQSLNMLVCTEGKERTLGEYAALLRQAGFAEVQGRVTPSPLDAVLAVELERVLRHRLDGLDVGLAAVVLELDLGEGDPAVG